MNYKKTIPVLMAVSFICVMCSCVSNRIENAEVRMSEFIDSLMREMTVEEKLGQLNLVTGGDMVTGHVMEVELENLIRRQEIG